MRYISKRFIKLGTILLSICICFSACDKKQIISKEEVSRKHVDAYTITQMTPVYNGTTTTYVPMIVHVAEHYDVTYKITYDDGSTKTKIVEEK